MDSAQTGVAARYFDGHSSRAHPVTVSVGDGHAELRGADGAVLRRAALASLRVSERIRRGPRLVTFDDGAYCEITDHAPFDAMLAATGYREGLVSRAQNSWRLALLSLAGIGTFVVLAYFYLLPWTAALVARTIPSSLEARLGEATLKSLDEGLVKPSALPPADQQRIRDNFAALRRPDDPAHDYRILFRQGGPIGPNALALPGGTIVVTDELVRLVGTGAGMMGVLAHEAGHVSQRHGLQQVFQASVVGAMATYLLGDVSALLATVPAAVLSMHYSREHEREADAFAVEVMRDNRLPVGALADALQALEDAHGPKRGGQAADAAGDEEAGFFSTHPLTKERIEAIRGGG
ncbi:M48 family metallopeptidase [Cupriavidus agavae]|uniref:Zn-dependent protease with chaperone function n=1 Tax=Cupriavidus agavae TaxID=1001822 RepID=A0A4Q7S6I7_9BURK|nr:M48 family metallopeptidase [Cupriavidus agavae]RZT41280.1 Zn-dependent protease with chaperone function [Cupriavidus agavae]